MALQTIPYPGLTIDATMQYFNFASTVTNTCDAAGESVTSIGRCVLQGGSGSKTISAAGGGKILFRTGAITFANAGTNFRVGVQDTASTGLEDGTFDVYADLTGGGGGISANTWSEIAMTSGTKTITHGDVIAISLEMTARGGTDAVNINSYSSVDGRDNNSLNYPYKTIDTGSGPTRSPNGVSLASIVFDDGTIGWIDQAYFYPYINASSTYSVSSTPDEYAAVFKVPFKCSIRGGWMAVGAIASTDNFEFVVYSDAQGTPVAERSITIDPNYTGSVSAVSRYSFFCSSFTMNPNVWYGISMRPTTNNTLSIGYLNFGSTLGSKYNAGFPFGANCKFSSRTNQSGAFTEVQTYYYPQFGIIIDKLDDGLGGGSWAYVG